MRIRGHSLARLRQRGNGHLARDRGEVFEKLVQGIASAKIVEQILHRNASRGEHWGTTLNLRVNFDDTSIHASDGSLISV